MQRNAHPTKAGPGRRHAEVKRARHPSVQARTPSGAAVKAALALVTPLLAALIACGGGGSEDETPPCPDGQVARPDTGQCYVPLPPGCNCS